MSTWTLRRIVIVTVSLQSALFGSMLLESFTGISEWPVRPLIGFFYLTFIPGIIIMRLTGITRSSPIEAILFCVGLSVAFVMIACLAINTILPAFGCQSPLSVMSIVAVISLFVLVGCGLCYARVHNRTSEYASREIGSIELGKGSLFSLSLIPFTVAGTQFFNATGNSIFVLVTLALIPVVIAASLLSSGRKEGLLPVVILSTSMSLMLHSSLVSDYIWGWDINTEHYLASLVVSSSYWDPSISYTSNGMLSVVMLSSAYSMVGDISLVHVFKVFYPCIFSLVPLGLYVVVRRQMGAEVAFLSAVFFMAYSTFYMEMVFLARQEIAELFLVLILLLVVNSRAKRIQDSAMLIVFGFALVVSHYSLAYYLAFALIGLALFRVITNSHVRTSLRRPILLTGTFACTYVVILLTWYYYTSSSSSVTTIVGISEKIMSTFFAEFLNPMSAQGVALITNSSSSPLHLFGKSIQILAQLLITIGVVSCFRRWRDMGIDRDYYALSLFSLAVMFAALTVPFFASALNTSRLYHIALLFLSPFLIVGLREFFKQLSRGTRYFLRRDLFGQKAFSRSIAAFVAVFLIVNTGLLYHVADDDPVSIALDSHIDAPRFSTQEVLGARWLVDANSMSSGIYADIYRSQLIGSLDWPNMHVLSNQTIPTLDNAFLFLGTRNVETDKILIPVQKGVIRDFEYSDLDDLTRDLNLILDNGGARGFVTTST